MIRMFIKRCIYKYQARLITWQVNYKRRNRPDSEVRLIKYIIHPLLQKQILKQKIQELVIEQERIELDLFKDVTIPDLREKESLKKTANKNLASAAIAETANSATGVPGTAGAPPSTAGESKKLAKANLTLINLKDIQQMLWYESDYELLDQSLLSRAP